MIIAQVCLRLATIKGHSKMCSFTVLGGSRGDSHWRGVDQHSTGHNQQPDQLYAKEMCCTAWGKWWSHQILTGFRTPPPPPPPPPPPKCIGQCIYTYIHIYSSSSFLASFKKTCLLGSQYVCVLERRIHKTSMKNIARWSVRTASPSMKIACVSQMWAAFKMSSYVHKE